MNRISKVSLLAAINVLLLFTLFYAIQPVQASEFSVTTTDDAGPGSLRQAIADAELAGGPDVITFDPGLNGQTISLTTGVLAITSELTIDAGTLPDSIRVSGNYTSRVFYINTGAIVTMTNLIIADGRAKLGGGACFEVCGGGIFVDIAGKLTLIDSLVTNNLASGGGGLATFLGDVTIDSSRIMSNSSQFEGGGLRFDGDALIRNSEILSNTSNDVGGGGIFFNAFDSSLHIISSTVAHNTAVTETFTSGGGIYLSSFGRVEIGSSTFAHNVAKQGGAIAARISSFESGTVQISNSTLSTNLADGNGSALYASAELSASLTLTLTHSTLAHNSGGMRIATDLDGIVTSTVRNTMIVKSTGDNCVNVTGDASNLADDATCTGFTQGHARLAPLADNGGPTLTHLPTTGSDAMGSANPTFCQTAPVNGVDQRGVARASDACDIGAVEVEDVSFVPGVVVDISPPLQGVAVGNTANFTVAVANTGNVTLTNIAVTGIAVIGAPVASCNRASGVLGNLPVGATTTYTCSLAINDSLAYTVEAGSQALVDEVAAGARISDTAGAQVRAASLAITKSAFVDGYREQTSPGVFNPSDCALASEITVPMSSTVKYCYTVTNTGDYTLTRHTLLDNQMVGPILDDLPQVLAPGAAVSTVDAGVMPTQTLVITTTNVATWTAALAPLAGVLQPQPVVVTASATVNISGPTRDQDGDGFLDNAEGTGDLDEDGIPNYLDDEDGRSSFSGEIYLPSLGK